MTETNNSNPRGLVSSVHGDAEMFHADSATLNYFSLRETRPMMWGLAILFVALAADVVRRWFV